MAKIDLILPDFENPEIFYNGGFWFNWCCDCGLRHIYLLKIIRGGRPDQDRVEIYCERDDWATEAKKTLDRKKKANG